MDAPVLTPSMRIAMTDLKLDHLYVVYPGERRYLLAEQIEAIPLGELAAAAHPADIFKARRRNAPRKRG